MSERIPPFKADQIGVQSVRFHSGVPIPSVTDASVDPYIKTRTSKAPLVEALVFNPQTTERYPGIIVLHEWWGLTSQIKDTAGRLAREGYVVLLPNLYARHGGMVTANAEVASALSEQIKDADVLQDLMSCCEFLNTQDRVQRAVHGVVGFGMGGTLAIRFACHRRRLRTAVSFYGNMVTPPELLKDLGCPLLYHQPGRDDRVSPQEVEQLRQLGKEFGKQVEILGYPDAPHAFMNETRKENYRPDAAASAWSATADFLKKHLT